MSESRKLGARSHKAFLLKLLLASPDQIFGRIV